MHELNTKTNIELIGDTLTHTHTHTHTYKKKKILDLIGFHENIAEYLIKAELPRKHSSFSHPRNDAEKSFQ